MHVCKHSTIMLHLPSLPRAWLVCLSFFIPSAKPTLFCRRSCSPGPSQSTLMLLTGSESKPADCHAQAVGPTWPGGGSVHLPVPICGLSLELHPGGDEDDMEVDTARRRCQVDRQASVG